MDIADVKNISIVGAGNMGHQLTLVCALNGFNTVCTDINGDILKKAESFADSYLKERVQKGKISEEEAAKVRSRISFVPDLKTAVEKTDYVIEAAVPWSVFGISPSVEKFYGFAFSISDNDVRDANVQQSMVSNLSLRILTDSTTWGNLVLSKP